MSIVICVIKIIYVWKKLEVKVPDSGVTLACEDDERQGRTCKIRSLKAKERTKSHISFQEIGPLLFNVLPRSIRNLKGSSIDEFKEKLDSFLTLVPDEPKVGGVGAVKQFAASDKDEEGNLER